MTAQTELPLTAPHPVNHPRASARKLALVHIGAANAQALAAIVERLARFGGRLTSDDLHAQIADFPAIKQCVEMHPESIPATLTNCKKAGVIRRTGEMVPSVRKSAHGRLISVWEGVSSTTDAR